MQGDCKEFKTMTETIDETKTGKDRSLENLKLGRWEKGESGNPDGKIPGTKNGLRSCFSQILAKEAPIDFIRALEAKGIDLEDRHLAEVIAYVTAFEAMKGNIQAVKLIIEQTEDPIPKAIHLAGANGEPLDRNWTVTYVKPSGIPGQPDHIETTKIVN